MWTEKDKVTQLQTYGLENESSSFIYANFIFQSKFTNINNQILQILHQIFCFKFEINCISLFSISAK